MSQFNYQTELRTIIRDKQLVEVHLNGAPTYKVAYILAANSECLTFAEVSSSATFAGIIMCRMDDVDAIKAETIYLSELKKQITNDSLHQQALKCIEGIEKFTFDGFVSTLENSNTIVDITYQNEDDLAGRVVGHDDTILVLDEFYTEYDRRFARSYINFDIISRISIDVPWLRTIARSLADKNI